ncbi:MAG: pyridoxal phosphate-dependent aminotransferase [Calditrichia bacterium]
MNQQGQELVRLHIGDTYLPPAYPLPLQDEFMSAQPDFNRYCNTFGVDALRMAVSEKVNEDNNLKATPENVLITSGATNALSAAMMAVVNPGEEVILLTPCWPFVRGMVTLAGGAVQDVPFYTELQKNPEMDIEEYLTGKLSSKTVAIYLNSPNNPSGYVLQESHLKAIAEFCYKHRLWLLSDEAYDGMVYQPNRHISIGSFPNVSAQVLSVFTFSKSMMFAGIRLGYLVADKPVVETVNKCMVHQIYSPPTFTQQMMVEPLRQRKKHQAKLIRHYQELRDLVLQTLPMEIPEPMGTYFCFFPVSAFLKGRTTEDIIRAGILNGVSVAPGGDFGPQYQEYLRLCFAGETPLRLERGLEKLKQVLLN